MSRRGAAIALVLAAVVVVAPVVAVAGGIAAGRWTPGGLVVVATPTPVPPPSDYAGFLADVRAGRVADVFETEGELRVTASEGSYVVPVPAEATDVPGDIAREAQAGGVTLPYYSSGDPDGGPVAYPLSWPDLLARVRVGEVYDVFHQGNRLTVTASDRPYEVEVPASVEDVLGELEAAAEAGGVSPPYYSKAPGD